MSSRSSTPTIPDSAPRIQRVLLTGAGGNIGRCVVQDLANDFELTLTDLKTPLESPVVIAADLGEFAQVEQLVKGVDAVVHLAVAAGGERGEDVPGKRDPFEERMLRVNPSSTYNVFEAARRHGIKRVVYASSLTIVLGDKHRERYDSTTPVLPTNLYACTKHFGEQLAGVYARNHGLSTICLRIGQPTPITHPHDEIWRTNRRARSWYVHVSDIARGIACALRTATPFGVYSLVSASDNPRVDWGETEVGIGYTPRAYFSAAGLSFHEGGEFPPHDGSILTHNPDESRGAMG